MNKILLIDDDVPLLKNVETYLKDFGYQIETASGDGKAANKYKLILETNFPESDQTAEVRRISGK